MAAETLSQEDDLGYSSRTLTNGSAQLSIGRSVDISLISLLPAQLDI